MGMPDPKIIVALDFANPMKALALADRRNDLELVKQLVGQHIKRLGMYKCDHCGFRARQYYWRCPGCGKWETYSPRRTETPDGYA